MRTFRKRELFILAGILFPFLMQAQFSLSGEFRPRTELSRGYASLAVSDQDASVFTSQRTRLNAMFKNDYLITSMVLQDVRNWGGQAQLVGNESNSISVHEAWAQIELLDELHLKAGRQELVYDDHRIFGNVGWAQQARSHDLLLLKYKKEWEFHLGLAFHQNSNRSNSDYNGPDAYKSMQFIWAHKKFESSNLSFLFLNNGKPDPLNPAVTEDQKTRFSQTIGGRYTVMLDQVSVATNLYLQTGKDEMNQEISAYNFLLEVSGKLSEETGIKGGFETLSGTGYDESSKNKSFNPFYGTNHKFNGFMDYFYVGNHINNVGLNDVYAHLNHKRDKLNFGAHLHLLSSAAKIAEGVDNYLGTEVDLSMGWAFKPMVKFDFGWSTLFASESMQELKGGDHTAFQQWGYIMITVTPDFIK